MIFRGMESALRTIGFEQVASGAMKQIIVRPFVPGEWQQYRDLRLQALRDSPDAFASTYEGSSLIPDDAWRQRLASADPEFELPLAGLHDDSLFGMAWATIHKDQRNMTHLYQMWVAPDVRGLGMGRMLLEAALNWARGRGCDALVLDVTSGDRPARRLYEAAGLLPVGEPAPLRPGSVLQTQSMRYDLSRSFR
jgi:GNAT superfamily N-acetyltransferase